MNHPIKVMAFDADDTLWACQTYFVEVERRYCALLAEYGDAEHISRELFKTETRNMAELGYGCKAFTLSLVENAVNVSGGSITATRLLEIQELGRSLLRLPATPLPGVEATLQQLYNVRNNSHQTTMKHDSRQDGLTVDSDLRLAVFTKGEIQDQQNKLERSGLKKWFDEVVVVADKTAEEYQRLCRRFGIGMEELLMVGNSFKSDIAPVLQHGGYAIYIPFKYTWAHEHTQEYDHDRLHCLTSFGQIPGVVGLTATCAQAPRCPAEPCRS